MIKEQVNWNGVYLAAPKFSGKPDSSVFGAIPLIDGRGTEDAGGAGKGIGRIDHAAVPRPGHGLVHDGNAENKPMTDSRGMSRKFFEGRQGYLDQGDFGMKRR